MAARKDANDTIDPSHHPTRKIESMSTLVAEMIVDQYDADESGARADAAAMEMARLIEVRTGPPPPPDMADVEPELPPFRGRRTKIALVVASVIAAGSIAALLLAR